MVLVHNDIFTYGVFVRSIIFDYAFFNKISSIIPNDYGLQGHFDSNNNTAAYLSYYKNKYITKLIFCLCLGPLLILSLNCIQNNNTVS